jgi:hypothetical protein
MPPDMPEQPAPVDGQDGDLRNLRRLLKEYVTVVPCTCFNSTQCWRCVFKYNLENPIINPTAQDVMGVLEDGALVDSIANKFEYEEDIADDAINAYRASLLERIEKENK